MAETLAAKIACERVARSYGVTVKNYRGDNLWFNEQAFQQSCHDAQQIFAYCGVGAHHQNAIAEAKNKQLSYGARKKILHAKRL